MSHKNKRRSEKLFGAIFRLPRPVFFAEVPKIGASEVADVIKKEEEGQALDVAGMVNSANSEFNKYQEQLKELPQSFSNMLHDEVVRYMRASPGRFEKDDKAGLSSAEFQAYRDAMISKVQELLKEYAPTEEDLKQIREAKAKSKEATVAAEKLQPIEAKDISESPGAIPDLQTLDSKFQEYNNWNAALQQEASSVLTAGGAVQTAYAAFKKARDGISSYKKFSSYLWPENDADRIALQNKIQESKTKIEQTIKKYGDSKGRLDKYASELATASNKQKEEKMKERDEKIRQLQERTDLTEAEKKEKADAYNRLESQQKSLEENRDKLDKYRENAAKGKDIAEKREDTAKMKKEQLGQCTGVMKTALEKVEDAMQNPNLTDEERQQLKQTSLQLREKLGEMEVGVKASNMVLESTKKEAVTLADAEKEAGARSLNLQRHLDEQVTPTINMLNGSIANLEIAKMDYATTKEQVMAHYEKMFLDYDKVDESVDNAILKNNLANEQMIGSLEAQQKSIGSMDVAPPSGWTGAFEATAGVVLGTIAGAAGWLGEQALDQATWLSNSLERSRQEMGTFSYVTARIGVEIVSSTIGVAGGLIEMAGGIVGMIAHPVNTAQGIGTLFGTNPDVSAGTAWKEMGKALISWEDFKHGRIGVGIGKMFVNVVTTIATGGVAGGAGKGAQAASLTGRAASRAAYTAAREAGTGVTRSLGRAAAASARGTGKAVAADVSRGVVAPAKGAAGAVKKGAGAMSEAGVSGMAKGAVNLGKRGVNAARETGGVGLAAIREAGVGGIARGTVRAGKSGVEFVGGSFKHLGEGMAARMERLWGGSRLQNVRDASKLRSVAAKEGKLIDDLGKNSERYNEFQAAMQKLRNENPGLSEAQLRLRFSEQDMHLFSDATRFERSLNKLEKAQAEFENLVKQNVHDPANITALDNIFSVRRKAQRMMWESSSEFKTLGNRLKKRDPDAMRFADEFDRALASGDGEKIAAVRAAHPEFEKVMKYLEGQKALEQSAGDLAVIRFKEQFVPEAATGPVKKAYEQVMELSDVNLRYHARFEDLKRNHPDLSNAEIQSYMVRTNPDLIRRYEQYSAAMSKLEKSLPAIARERPFTILANESGKFLVIDEMGRIRVAAVREEVAEGVAKLNVLSQGQLRNAETLFRSFIEHTRFNNSAMTLEFVGFFRKAKAKNPAMTMDQALAMFNLDAPAIVSKYGGGNCFALSRKFVEELRAQGIDAYVIGNQGFNAALQLDGVPWFNGLEYIERAHGSVMVKYLDPATGTTKYMHFEMGIGRTRVEHYSSLDILKTSRNPSGGQYINPEMPILNTESAVLKNQLRVRNKLYVMSDVAMEEAFGIDLMKGKMYVQRGSDAADVLEEFAGRSAIDINAALREPNKMIALRVRGRDRHMTQAEALYLYVDVVRQRFNQPSDFTENVLHLLTNRDEYYRSLILEEARPLYQPPNPI